MSRDTITMDALNTRILPGPVPMTVTGGMLRFGLWNSRLDYATDPSKLVPIGAVGQLLVGDPVVAKDYYNRSDLFQQLCALMLRC